MARGFGSIVAYGKGKWRCFWYEHGIHRSKVVEGTYRDAQLFLARKQLELSPVDKGIRYRDYWQRAVVPTFAGLAERTVYDYGRLWKVELEPRIGAQKVAATTWRYVDAVLAKVRSPQVQHSCFRLWKKVCNMAVRDGLLDKNPVGRNTRLKAIEKREKTIPTPAQIAELLEAAAGYKHVYLVAVELGAGLRHEEACALTKADVTFEEGRAILSVSKALTVAGGKVIQKDTKTAFSRRLVALGEPFCSVLAANMDKVPDTVEGQSSPVTISRNWKKYCDRNGLRHIPFGQMRTVFSTLHQQAGSVDSLVSLAMGHSDGTTRGANYLVQTLPAMRLLADNLTAFFVC